MKPYAILALALASVGCAHSGGQILTPTVHSVTITITPPSQAAYTYAVARAELTSGTQCPLATTTAYTDLNPTSRLTGTIYVDKSAAGTTACYYVMALDSSGGISAPSNVAGPFVVPANPTAPVINGQSAKNDMPEPTLAKNEVPQIHATVQ